MSSAPRELTSAPSHRGSIRPRGRLNAISVCYQQIGSNGPFAFIQMLVLVDDQIRPNSLLKNPRQNESSLIQFFNHESVEARMRGAFTDQGAAVFVHFA